MEIAYCQRMRWGTISTAGILYNAKEGMRSVYQSVAYTEGTAVIKQDESHGNLL